jgi:hypothetical protein
MSNWKWKLIYAIPVAIVALAIMLPQPHAQGVGATIVQQSSQMLNASTKVATSTPTTINNQTTATATPSGSNYVYITGIDLAACQDATGTTAVTNLTFTTTNITGAPVYQFSLAATANLCATPRTIQFATPLKSSTPGTAVTVVSPAANAHAVYTSNIYWYEGQ